MTNLEAIQKQFTLIGTISDEGAVLFAVDNGIDAKMECDDESLKAISSAIDNFVETNTMRSQSVSEGGFSMSFTAMQCKNNLMLKLRKYGISVSDDSAHLLGLSVIKDVTNRW